MRNAESGLRRCYENKRHTIVLKQKRMKHKIICGDATEELKKLPENSVDACVTDPPYELNFMNRSWDRSGIAFNTEMWQELYRVLKPGAHILVAGIARTHHRMWVALEDAGFEIRDGIYHVFGSGFPKSMDISKELDKKRRGDLEQIRDILREKLKKYDRHDLANKLSVTVRQIDHWIKQNENQPQIPSIEKWNLIKTFVDIPEKEELKCLDTRITEYNYEVIGIKNRDAGNRQIPILQGNTEVLITTPSTEEAIQWNGWGTALKPAVEIWCLARKPISERNIAANVLRWGVGGINVDSCRVGLNGGTKSKGKGVESEICYGAGLNKTGVEPINKGRFPSNLILECCCEEDELMMGNDPTHPGQYRNTRTPKRIFESEIGINEKNKNEVTCEKSNKCVIHTNPNCVCRMLDEQTEGMRCHKPETGKELQSKVKSPMNIFGAPRKQYTNRRIIARGDVISPSRFFYCAKASQNERYFYCTICKQAYPMKERDKHIHNALENEKYKYLEFHPTQKPLQLIQYLVRLVTPPHGTVLDLFMGTGTTLIAAEKEGFNCVGIDSSPIYCEIAFKRAKEKIIQQKISGVQSTIEKTGF